MDKKEDIFLEGSTKKLSAINYNMELQRALACNCYPDVAIDIYGIVSSVINQLNTLYAHNPQSSVLVLSRDMVSRIITKLECIQKELR